MHLEARSLNLPVAMQQQLEGHSPEKWVDTIWKAAEGKKEKRLLKLLTAVIQCDDSTCAADIALIARQAFEKLEANKKALSPKKVEHLEMMSRFFKDTSIPQEKINPQDKSDPKPIDAPAAAVVAKPEVENEAENEAEKSRATFEWVCKLVTQSGQYKGNTLEEIFQSVQAEKEEWAKGFS